MFSKNKLKTRLEYAKVFHSKFNGCEWQSTWHALKTMSNLIYSFDINNTSFFLHFIILQIHCLLFILISQECKHNKSCICFFSLLNLFNNWIWESFCICFWKHSSSFCIMQNDVECQFCYLLYLQVRYAWLALTHTCSIMYML